MNIILIKYVEQTFRILIIKITNYSYFKYFYNIFLLIDF